MAEKVDVVIVGAGPAGISCAIKLAQNGIKPLVIERGEYPGAKNVQGAVLYSHPLNLLIPDFHKKAPLERQIIEERLHITTETSITAISFRTHKFEESEKPANCYTILRKNFDLWYAKEAENLGVDIITGIRVDDVIKNQTKIKGIKTQDGDEVQANVVVACDGANSFLAQKAGLIDKLKPDEVAIAVKETIELGEEKINDRFNLEKNEGIAGEFIGSITKGMLGYGFIYTNKSTLSVGIGCGAIDFMEKRIAPYELLEYFKSHPFVRKLIQGGKVLEYAAHIIPEGGFYSMPPLYSDGFLICGDAAQMVNPSHREGSNLAMMSGILAAETIIEAMKKGDFSKKTLSLYEKKIKASFIYSDLYEHKDLERVVRENMHWITKYPDLIEQAGIEYFTVDGIPKRKHQSKIFKNIIKGGGFKLVREAIKLRQLFK